MPEERDNEDITRRQVLGALGTAAIGAGAGCVFGPRAAELKSRADEAETSLKSELPWNTYDLEFEVENLKVGLQPLQPTGVENAYQYGVVVNVPLANVSNDLEGYLATEERAAEFFSLYAPPSFDMLLETYDNFQDFTPPDQPSHRNQVSQYTLHVDAEKCSYIEDTVSSSRIDDILSSPDDYLDYLDGGDAVEPVVDDGEPFGLGLWC